ncbi:MAG: hypothetical protein IKP98_00570 [Bacilli bacterium]|nr:hypothetical protein [Bacilli bacterium]MBR4350710.1 hypothetical protein [Bacilli bacterium]MBR4618753.1 hypothetical protein [Bacilli bacterium]
MNKIRLDETINEVLYLKHIKNIIDRLYKEKSLLTEEEHKIIINECDKRILKCESDYVNKKEEYNEVKSKQEEKKSSRKNNKTEKYNNESIN